MHAKRSKSTRSATAKQGRPARETSRTVVRVTQFNDHEIAMPATIFNGIARDPLFDQIDGRKVPTLHSVLRPELGYEHGEDFVRLPAGLYPHIARLLAHRGLSVVISDRAYIPTVTVPLEMPHDDSQLSALQQSFLNALGRNVRCMGIVSDPSERIELLDAVCWAQPQQHVVALVGDAADANRVACALRPCLDRIVTAGAEYRWHSQPMLHVDTVSSILGRSTCDFEVLVCLDTAAVLTKTAMVQLTSMHRTRRIALVCDVAGLHSIDRVRLEAMFGIPNFFPGMESDRLRSTHVTLVVSPSPQGSPPRTAFAQKRNLVWRNPTRNQLVATIAQAVRSRNLHVLRETIGESIARRVGELDPDTAPGILIIAENAEHAREIERYLSGWQRDETNCAKFPIFAEQSIATLARVASALIIADVVIYAAGSRRQWMQSAGAGVFSGPPAVVVDVVDGALGEQVAEAIEGLQAYQSRGWTLEVVEVDAAGGLCADVEQEKGVHRPNMKGGDVRISRETVVAGGRHDTLWSC